MLKKAPVHRASIPSQLVSEGKDQDTEGEEEDVMEQIRGLFIEDSVELIKPRAEAYLWIQCT